jgi:glycine/D-amino acid oxidase-like deaminating enzyme
MNTNPHALGILETQGLTAALELRKRHPKTRIALLERRRPSAGTRAAETAAFSTAGSITARTR